MALSDLVDVKIELGLGPLGGGEDLWDSGQWGIAVWSSTEIQWQDYTSLCEGFTTRSGKSGYLARNRAAVATLTMDNTDGLFRPGQDQPGVLDIRPGRLVRISARPKPTVSYPVPIPDGTTWTDQTGRTWEAHGDSLTLDVVNQGYEPLWYGYIDSIDNLQSDTNLQTRLRCVDAFSRMAVNTGVAQTSQGAGELTGTRISRILDHYNWPADTRDIDPGTKTVQATTLASDMLTLCQLTTDSEGTTADFWQKPDGTLAFRQTGWKPTQPIWYFGGVAGMPVRSATPEWSQQLILNEAHTTAVGGTTQVNQDTVSQAVFGRRTWVKTGLLNDQDTDVAAIGAEVVARNKADRVVLRTASVLCQDAESAGFMTGISMGDMLQVTVDTIQGWSDTYLVNVVGISDSFTPSAWVMDLVLDDSQVVNEYGPYSRAEYSEAYHLGEQEED